MIAKYKQRAKIIILETSSQIISGGNRNTFFANSGYAVKIGKLKFLY